MTGHRSIPAEALGEVRSALAAELACAARRAPRLEALSSLAAGADQIFAELALDRGALLTVVCPGADYEATLAPDELSGYRRLRGRAHAQIRLDHQVVDDDAYYAAGAYIADHSDVVLAVWDGLPARGRGGTADVVAYARTQGTPVIVIWKSGVQRP